MQRDSKPKPAAWKNVGSSASAWCAEKPRGFPDHTGAGGHGQQMGSSEEQGMGREKNSSLCISTEASRPGLGQAKEQEAAEAHLRLL